MEPMPITHYSFAYFASSSFEVVVDTSSFGWGMGPSMLTNSTLESDSKDTVKQH